MALKVKEQYLEYSIGGGKVKSIKLKNLNPSHYELYYNKGFKDFFDVIDEEVIEEEINEEVIIEEDIIDVETFLNDEEDITD